MMMKKKSLKKYFILLCCLFFSAIVFNLFLYPLDLVTGGVNGIAILTSHFLNITPAITIWGISVILLIFSFFLLDKEQTIASLLSTFLYPFFVYITSLFVRYIVIDLSDYILISLIVGILLGISNGILYKIGFSTGGLNIMSQLLYRYFHIPYSKTTFVINSIIVIIGGFVFGFPMVLYALIIIFVNSKVIDRVLLGTSKSKAFYITTTKEKQIRKYIIDHLHHSVTSFDVKGGFLFNRKKVLLAVVPSRDYFKLTEGIKLIDKDAFFVACNAYEVEGGK